METYCLNSRLVEGDTELEVRTSRNTVSGKVSSSLYVNGQLKDTLEFAGHVEASSDDDALALVRWKHEDLKREIESLLNARRAVLDSGDSQAMRDLGVAFLYRNLYDEAGHLFRAAIEADSEDHQALDLLSRVEVVRGDSSAAVDCARRAVAHCPTYADYHNTLGEAMSVAGLHQGAVAAFQKAIDINLYYADAHFNLGLVLVDNEIHKQAPRLSAKVLARCRDCFTKAALIYGSYLQPQFDDGMRALQEADFMRASELMKTVRAAKREEHRREFAPLYARFVEVAGQELQESLAGRIRQLKEQIEKNPTYVDLRADLARCYVEQSRLSWQAGLEQYQHTLGMNPSWELLRRQADEVERQYHEICAVVERIREVR